MKESKDRTEQFMYSTANAANQAPSSACLPLFLVPRSPSADSYLFSTQRQDPMGDGSSRLDTKGKGRAASNGAVLALNLEQAEEGTGQGGGGGGAFMQMQLVEQQVCPFYTRCPRPDSMHSRI